MPGFSPTRAAETGIREQVDVTLTGSFEHGRISVDGHTIPLDEEGAGSEVVRLFPPDVEVQLLLVTPAPAKYAFSVAINGRSVDDDGIVGGGKVVKTFTYQFIDFDL